jgi:hypothetical protein
MRIISENAKALPNETTQPLTEFETVKRLQFEREGDKWTSKHACRSLGKSGARTI